MHTAQAYMLRAGIVAKDPSSGAPIDDVGKNVEIFHKQSNGEWKCAVDVEF